VTHNMRCGVAERLGVGYDDLRRHNPSIHLLRESRVRSSPLRGEHPGTDQSGSALAGQEWEDGGCSRGGRPFFGTSSWQISIATRQTTSIFVTALTAKHFISVL